MNIEDIGWSDFFSNHFEPYAVEGLSPARVAQEHKQQYLIYSEYGELTAEVSGSMLHRIRSRSDFPCVGDWVVTRPRTDEAKATIHALLPRKSSFSRKAVLAGGPKYGAGKTEEQILAANIEVVFLVSGLDNDFNPRRIERYVAVAWDSGASPVIVLNKSDVCINVASHVEDVETVAPGIPVHPVSAVRNEGVEILRKYVRSGTTAAFLGSSGVGKSTLINTLLGEEKLDTGGVRLDDSRGRHTTTRRELILLPEGGALIDTPGMREIQMWSNEEGLKRTFEDIEALIARCRFSDCRHDTEPGCAVRAALEDGELDSGRFRSYLKLQKELRHLALRQNKAEARRETREWDRKIRQHHRAVKEMRKKGLA